MKHYKNAKQQIFILKRNHHLRIDQEDYAREILGYYGYHEVINGYQDVFKQDNNIGEFFDEDTTFLDVSNMFYLDMELRGVLRVAIERFEMTFKEAVSEHISKAYGEFETVHLDRSHFRTGKFHKNKNGSNYSDLDWLQGRIRKALHSNDILAEHHRKKGNIPPWIFFKQLNFGEMKTYFSLLNDGNIKTDITRTMLQREFIEEAGIDIDKTFLIELINLVHRFRNRSSHANRIYNYAPIDENGNTSINSIKQIFPLAFSQEDYREGIGRTGIYSLILGFSTLNNLDSEVLLGDYVENNFLMKFTEPRYFIYIALSLKYPLGFLDPEKYLPKPATPPTQAKKHY